MPEIEKELDERNRLVLPKEIFDKWGNRIVIYPNSFAAVIFPKNCDLEHVIKSTEILLADMKHKLEVERERREKKNG
ncbi:MAG: hypothetical protein QW356_03955 [Candidatus Hadarchaeales archaeon]